MSPHNKLQNEETKTKQSNYTHSLIAAGVSGFGAGLGGFFFEGMKKRAQSNQPTPNFFKLGPRLWLQESFRGIWSAALTNTPASVAQQVSAHFFEAQNMTHTLAGKTISMAFSGALGGIPAAMIGNIVLEQQLKKIGPKEAFIKLSTQGSTRILKGLIPTMARESVFGWCYLDAMPRAGDYATTHWGSCYSLPTQILVGISGSLVSHPFDTVATCMQQFNCSTIPAVKKLWQENGLRSFYKGASWRMGVFITGSMINKELKALTLDTLEEHHGLR